MKKSFVLYNDYRDHIKLLEAADKAKLLDAIFAYADGEEVELEGAVAMAFSFIKAQMDRDAAKYQEKCEKLRESGSKGGLAKARNAKQMLENGSDAKQGLANLADNDTDNVTDNDTDNVNDKDKGVNYQLIADMYNDICISFPRLTKLSDARKKAINARLKKYSLDDIKKVFTMAEESDFLKGSNKRNWSANFDWLMNDTNMAKVLDGNYTNKASKIEIDNNFRNFLSENEVVNWG